jgi:hypothetical protein
MSDKIRVLDGKTYVWNGERWVLEVPLRDLVAPTEPTLSDAERKQVQAEADKYQRARQDWPATLDAVRDIESRAKQSDKEFDSKLARIKGLLKDQWSQRERERIESPEAKRKAVKERFLDKILRRRRRRGPLP